MGEEKNNFKERSPFFNNIEGVPWSEIGAIQEKLLIKQIAYVLEGSKFYQDHLKKYSVTNFVLKSRRDLDNLPFTTKNDLKDDLLNHSPRGLNQIVPLQKIRRFCTTSGTTGKPYYHAVTENDLYGWHETYARCLYAAGFTPGKDVAIYVGSMANMFAVGVYMSGALDYMKIPAFLIGMEGGKEKTLRLIKEHQGIITAMYGFPNYVHYLGAQCEKVLGESAKALKIEKMCLGGEPGTSKMRESLESMWGAEVYESMGISEVSMMFSECRGKNGMHWIAHEFILPEIINPETGQGLPIEKGVEGELTVTSLDKETNPLIRYRTKDIVRVVDTVCPCGRKSPKFIIIGRSDDMLIYKGQKVWPADIKGVITGFRPRVTGEIRIVLNQPEYSFNHPIMVKVETEKNLKSKEIETLKDEIEKSIRALLVVRAEVHLVPKGTFPTEVNMAGKMSLFERTYMKPS